eukprot:1180391-Prorocentrum_minimum.AAC.1
MLRKCRCGQHAPEEEHVPRVRLPRGVDPSAIYCTVLYCDVLGLTLRAARGELLERVPPRRVDPLVALGEHRLPPLLHVAEVDERGSHPLPAVSEKLLVHHGVVKLVPVRVVLLPVLVPQHLNICVRRGVRRGSEGGQEGVRRGSGGGSGGGQEGVRRRRFQNLDIEFEYDQRFIGGELHPGC